MSTSAPGSNLSSNPAVTATLDQWHSMITSKSLKALPELLDAKVVFRSPMAYKPYEGAQMVNVILNTVIQVFENFEYHRQLVSADGQSVVLEFSATVGDRQLKGIDMVQFNAEGKIVDFEVMIRPMSGLQALGEEMGKRLAPFLAKAPA
ncbi:nuclear transport factor 2 family protein [Pseudomonas turukhanskensis]|uniref:SnoaL-like domain-containing protein n=1 Tax=Pseudomonas turukhanskensis TaxID=1806536 RepID=A0A9W6K4A8_9PSED|nr:nuclear transport factor 2 family protein [Pseudomonas turukhanskensis]GLK88597.1 hypothetical protein GCM10017655_16590 [Pseudomonas turukhanskensis]